MKTIIFMIAIAPMLLEVYVVDPHYWSRGKSDKPASTIFRIVFTFVLMCVFGAEVALVVLGYYCFFDLIIGWKKKRDPFYTGSGPWDRFIGNIPPFVSVFFRVGIAAFLWVGYFYAERPDMILHSAIEWLNDYITIGIW